MGAGTGNAKEAEGQTEKQTENLTPTCALLAFIPRLEPQAGVALRPQESAAKSTGRAGDRGSQEPGLNSATRQDRLGRDVLDGIGDRATRKPSVYGADTLCTAQSPKEHCVPARSAPAP